MARSWLRKSLRALGTTILASPWPRMLISFILCVSPLLFLFWPITENSVSDPFSLPRMNSLLGIQSSVDNELLPSHQVVLSWQTDDNVLSISGFRSLFRQLDLVRSLEVEAEAHGCSSDSSFEACDSNQNGRIILKFGENILWRGNSQMRLQEFMGSRLEGDAANGGALYFSPLCIVDFDESNLDYLTDSDIIKRLNSAVAANSAGGGGMETSICDPMSYLGHIDYSDGDDYVIGAHYAQTTIPLEFIPRNSDLTPESDPVKTFTDALFEAFKQYGDKQMGRNNYTRANAPDGTDFLVWSWTMVDEDNASAIKSSICILAVSATCSLIPFFLFSSHFKSPVVTHTRFLLSIAASIAAALPIAGSIGLITAFRITIDCIWPLSSAILFATGLSDAFYIVNRITSLSGSIPQSRQSTGSDSNSGEMSVVITQELTEKHVAADDSPHDEAATSAATYAAVMAPFMSAKVLILLAFLACSFSTVRSGRFLALQCCLGQLFLIISHSLFLYGALVYDERRIARKHADFIPCLAVAQPVSPIQEPSVEETDPLSDQTVSTQSSAHNEETDRLANSSLETDAPQEQLDDSGMNMALSASLSPTATRDPSPPKKSWARWLSPIYWCEIYSWLLSSRITQCVLYVISLCFLIACVVLSLVRFSAHTPWDLFMARGSLGHEGARRSREGLGWAPADFIADTPNLELISHHLDMLEAGAVGDLASVYSQYLSPLDDSSFRGAVLRSLAAIQAETVMPTSQRPVDNWLSGIVMNAGCNMITAMNGAPCDALDSAAHMNIGRGLLYTGWEREVGSFFGQIVNTRHHLDVLLTPGSLSSIAISRFPIKIPLDITTSQVALLQNAIDSELLLWGRKPSLADRGESTEITRVLTDVDSQTWIASRGIIVCACAFLLALLFRASLLCACFTALSHAFVLIIMTGLYAMSGAGFDAVTTNIVVTSLFLLTYPALELSSLVETHMVGVRQRTYEHARSCGKRNAMLAIQEKLGVPGRTAIVEFIRPFSDPALPILISRNCGNLYMKIPVDTSERAVASAIVQSGSYLLGSVVLITICCFGAVFSQYIIYNRVSHYILSFIAASLMYFLICAPIVLLLCAKVSLVFVLSKAKNIEKKTYLLYENDETTVNQRVPTYLSHSSF